MITITRMTDVWESSSLFVWREFTVSSNFWNLWNAYSFSLLFLVKLPADEESKNYDAMCNMLLYIARIEMNWINLNFMLTY